MVLARFALPLLLSITLPLALSQQVSPPEDAMAARMRRNLDPGTGAWDLVQIATMARLRDAAMDDAYADEELSYLTNDIGPRLAGSPQAETALEWMAAQMRALGASVTLEKTMVPHWVRGKEQPQSQHGRARRRGPSRRS